LGSCLCACGAVCTIWRRGGGEVGRKVRRTILAVCVVTSFISFYFSLSSSPRGLPQFRESAVNCSVTPVPSVRGEVGVVTRHQWYHAVGYSLDDLRVHWAFPLHPGTEDTTTSLRRDFDQKAWKAVGGKYAHRIFGHLLPPVTGQYVFQVSLSETTAKASLEFWLSPTFHPWQTLLLAFSSLSDKVSTSPPPPPSFLLQPLSTDNSEQQFQKSRSLSTVMWCLLL
jgi:hypothetical protein